LLQPTFRPAKAWSIEKGLAEPAAPEDGLRARQDLCRGQISVIRNHVSGPASSAALFAAALRALPAE